MSIQNACVLAGLEPATSCLEAIYFYALWLSISLTERKLHPLAGLVQHDKLIAHRVNGIISPVRLLIAALAISLTVATVAAIFAIWPVVGHAPWETESASPTIIVSPTPDPCVMLRQQIADAHTDLAYYTLAGLARRKGCLQ